MFLIIKWPISFTLFSIIMLLSCSKFLGRFVHPWGVNLQKCKRMVKSRQYMWTAQSSQWRMRPSKNSNIHDDWELDVCEKNPYDPLLGGIFIPLHCQNNKLHCIQPIYFLLSTTAATRVHNLTTLVLFRLLFPKTNPFH